MKFPGAPGTWVPVALLNPAWPEMRPLFQLGRIEYIFGFYEEFLSPLQCNKVGPFPKGHFGQFADMVVVGKEDYLGFLADFRQNL